MTIATMTGEPYELEGNRIVFTNWFFVRQGWFGWECESENPTGSCGPWDRNYEQHDIPRGIKLVAQPAQRVGPILELERPWEVVGLKFSTIIRDGGIYRAWGAAQSAVKNFHCCYFESDDGLDWRRPELGLVEFQGTTKNNLCEIGRGGDFVGGTVFIDPNGPAEERYKWVCPWFIDRETLDAYLSRKPEGRMVRHDGRNGENSISAIQGAVSPDGIRWTRIEDPLVVDHCDTQLTAYYDAALRKYVVYTRNYVRRLRSERASDPFTYPTSMAGRRCIGRTESDNFREFPFSEMVMEPGPDMLPSDMLYTNCRTTVPGAPEHHLMFPAVFHTAIDTTSIILASSYDGKSWVTVPGGAVLGTSEFGQWDGGCIFSHPNLIELLNGDFALPYTGFIFPHKYPRGEWRYLPGYAVWPKGRLVALDAPERGEFATTAIMPPGRKLKINALTKRAGSITTEVATMDGKPIPGRTFEEAVPIVGDQFRAQVVWKEHDDLGFADDRGITIRFRLDKAKVFGLDFE
jgi:hypothetical protein